jgi:hypothetical protein
VQIQPELHLRHLSDPVMMNFFLLLLGAPSRKHTHLEVGMKHKLLKVLRSHCFKLRVHARL